MKYLQWARLLIFLLVWLINFIVAAAENPVQPEMNEIIAIPSLNALQANWVFSGRVTTESGEYYYYYFEMQRDHTKFHAVAMLFDNQSREVLFEEGNAEITRSEALPNWQVGKTFLQFNPINNSWVFGVKTKAQQGFNFRIDLLGQPANASSSIHYLRSGVKLLVIQTGPLNGHLQSGIVDKEQFVIASKSWFKHIWTDKPQKLLHPLIGILCQFNDGSSFYAVNLQAPDALQGAIAGWRNGQGLPMSMSQFVTAKKSKKGIWSIGIASPQVHLALESILDKENGNYQLVAGISKKIRQGFCTISKNEIGQEKETAKL